MSSSISSILFHRSSLFSIPFSAASSNSIIYNFQKFLIVCNLFKSCRLLAMIPWIENLTTKSFHPLGWGSRRRFFEGRENSGRSLLPSVLVSFMSEWRLFKEVVWVGVLGWSSGCGSPDSTSVGPWKVRKLYNQVLEKLTFFKETFMWSFERR